MRYFGATLFVKQGVGIEFQCLCREEGVNKNGSTAFIVVLVSKAIIRNTKAHILALRTNKRASQEIREVVKDFQAPPPACKQPQHSLWEIHRVPLWEY